MIHHGCRMSREVFEEGDRKMSLRMVERRKELGMSQSAVARAALMHLSSVSAIETGRMRPWPGQARKIAEVLGWPADRMGELFEDAGPGSRS